MKININRFIGCITSVAFMSSCSPLYYAPSSPNMPMMIDKGDITGNIYIGRGDDVDVMGASAAFSPFKNIGITGSAFSAQSIQSSESANNGYGSSYDFGALYYRHLSPHILFDCVAGYGFGKLHINADYIGAYDSGIKRWYIQPSIYGRKNNAEIGIAIRVLKLNYNQPFLFRGSQVENAPNDSSYFFMEPTLKIGVGLKHFKFFAQGTFAGNVFNSPSLNYSVFNAIIGVTFFINPNLGKKNKDAQ
ncbi:MAG: hypothetical protein IPP29_13545 [Bacteroidetes bacterium]|nr:hypothetical protein [Bacteroidota bacterium]